VNDPIATAARAAAQRLGADTNPRLAAEVEATLAGRESAPSAPPHYFDPISLAGLIVDAASFAWTVYTDLRKRTAHPMPEVVARTVRVKLRDSDQTVPDHVVDVVVTEIVKAGADQDALD
jgi:hypothetical protein